MSDPAVLQRLDRIERLFGELITSIEALAGSGLGIAAPLPDLPPPPELVLDLGNGRRVLRHDSGWLELREADGSFTELTRNSPEYRNLGLGFEAVLVDYVRDDDSRTVYWPDGGVKIVMQDVNFRALVWVGSHFAYGTMEQSNELKYGSRQPSAEQIDTGGANVLPPAP